MPTHRLRHKLLSLAHNVLGMVRVPPDEPIAVEVAEEGVAVVVRVCRCREEATPGRARVPGRHLSTAEALIWECLAAEALQGKQIAARMNWEYGPKLKTLLANLVDREVLEHDDGVGYFRAPSDPA
jgi:hypothetical protein